MDRKKVIKGLYACATFGEDGVTDGDCKICPYDKGYATGECWVQMNRDALAMLKEQETVDKNTGEWKNGHCSCCGEDVSSMLDTWTNVQNFLFCPICGAKMEER